MQKLTEGINDSTENSVRGASFEGVCANYRHPGPRRVWKEGPSCIFASTSPAPVAPVVSSQNADLAAIRVT